MPNFFFKIPKNKRTTEGVTPKRPEEYNKIIFSMSNMTMWPERTTIRCWNCTRTFIGKPVGLPYKIIDGVYYVKGYFCGFKCANTYNLNNSGEMKWSQETYLNMLYLESGNSKLPIGYSPPKELLIYYGGIYTDEEYEKIMQNDYVINIKYPPLISLSPSITLTSMDDAKKNVSESEHRFSRKQRLIVK